MHTLDEFKGPVTKFSDGVRIFISVMICEFFSPQILLQY